MNSATYAPHLIALLATFVSVFIKGFQHKNINGDHLKAIAITSYLMAITDVVMISLIVQNGLPIAFACGTGAALGMICSIKFHAPIMGKLTQLLRANRT